MSVLVYSTPNCPHCNRAKTYLREQNIQFSEYDVSKDRLRAREMVEISGQNSVPTLVVNGRVIVGFEPKLIDDALSKKPPPKREVALQNLIFDPFEQ